MKNKNSTILALIMTLGIISSCNSSKVDLDLSNLYSYPEDSLYSQKTFVCIHLPDSSILYKKVIIVSDNEGKYSTTISYYDNEKQDSTVINYSDAIPKIESSYTFMYDSIERKLTTVKREIEKDEYIPSADPFGRHIIEDKYKFKGFLEKNKNEIYFLCDTLYYWNDSQLPAQYFQRSAKKTVRSTIIPFIRKSKKAEGYGILAKDIGLVEEGIVLDDILYTTKLIEIK